MKHIAWVPVALLLGLIAGAWGPRSELRQAREEIGRLEALLKQKGAARGERLTGITRMLSIPEADTGGDAPPATAARPADVAPGDGGNEEEGSAPVAEAEREESTAAPSVAEASDAQDERLAARIEQAVELWQLRSEIARSTFVSNAGLSHDAAIQFDVLVTGMNIRLADHIETWAEVLKSEDAEVSEETGVRLMSDLTGDLVLTYDELNRTMPEGWREAAGPEFSLTDMIDPRVAEPLIDVEDKLSGRRGGPFR